MSADDKVAVYCSLTWDGLSEEDRSRSQRACLTCEKMSEAPMLCSRCKRVYFCDVGCQRQKWPEHKSLCKTPEEDPRPPAIFLTISNVTTTVTPLLFKWKEQHLGVGFFMVKYELNDGFPFKATKVDWYEFGSDPFMAYTSTSALKPIVDDLTRWLHNPTREIFVYFVFFNMLTNDIKIVEQPVTMAENFKYPPVLATKVGIA